MIKVYSTPTCSYCKKLKDLLEDNGIEYENIDIVADPSKREEMTNITGRMTVPTTIIGKDVLVGYDEPLLKKLLKI